MKSLAWLWITCLFSVQTIQMSVDIHNSFHTCTLSLTLIHMAWIGSRFMWKNAVIKVNDFFYIYAKRKRKKRIHEHPPCLLWWCVPWIPTARVDQMAVTQPCSHSPAAELDSSEVIFYHLGQFFQDTCWCCWGRNWMLLKSKRRLILWRWGSSSVRGTEHLFQMRKTNVDISWPLPLYIFPRRLSQRRDDGLYEFLTKPKFHVSAADANVIKVNLVASLNIAISYAQNELSQAHPGAPQTASGLGIQKRSWAVSESSVGSWPPKHPDCCVYCSQNPILHLSNIWRYLKVNNV